MVLSPENLRVQGADVVDGRGRQHLTARYSEHRQDPAWSETHSMHGSSMRGNREIPGLPISDGWMGRGGKA